jgi:putative polymerase
MAAGAVIFGTILFNPILALINAHLVQLTPTAVIGGEVVLVTIALALSLNSKNAQQGKWIGLIVCISLLDFVEMIGNGTFDLKFPRDALIIPIFALLGLTADRASVIRIIVPLQWVVLVFMLFEAIRPDEFGHVFDVMSYYINTRGFQRQDFWSQETLGLFVSAARPGERFLFPSLNIHRLSSVFLEPVSLGNYCVIISMILVALWDDIRTHQRIFLVISTAMILIGCDGRFALIAVLLMVIVRFVAPLLPRYSNVIYLPCVLASAAIVTNWFQLFPVGDDFTSRMAGSINMLSQMGLTDLLGYNVAHAHDVMDSGIAYLLYSQSLQGAIVLWAMIALALPQRDRASIIFSHATSIYIALNLLVSYSAFSIKTAGLLWFAFGAISRTSSAQKIKLPARLASSKSATLAAERW